MTYKKIKLKRLYNNVASVRDYVWEDCIKKGVGIEFTCENMVMRVEPDELVTRASPGGQKFKSKFDGKEYQLVDFIWK